MRSIIQVLKSAHFIQHDLLISDILGYTISKDGKLYGILIRYFQMKFIYHTINSFVIVQTTIFMVYTITHSISFILRRKIQTTAANNNLNNYSVAVEFHHDLCNSKCISLFVIVVCKFIQIPIHVFVLYPRLRVTIVHIFVFELDFTSCSIYLLLHLSNHNKQVQKKNSGGVPIFVLQV